MARRPTIEERISELSALRGSAMSPELEKTLLKALGVKTGLVVEAAVEVIETLDLPPAASERIEAATIEAFARLTTDGVKRDPLCRAKHAIAKLALARGRFVEPIFGSGVFLVQLEPVWGGKQDTATDLRALCGLAYAELYHPDAVTVLARLLADTQRNARAGAAHALGNTARPEAIPLLRYKALIGDDDGDVFASVLRALLALDPDDSIDFIATLLTDQRTAEGAALCLGESRLLSALPHLRQYSADERNTEVGYLAIALLRQEPATDFLIAQIGGGTDEEAQWARAALETLPMDERLVRRIEEAEALRGS